MKTQKLTLSGKVGNPKVAEQPLAVPPVPGQLYPLSDLPRRSWMPRKGRRPISYWTCLRWAISGRSGVKLKTLMVGGCRCCCDQWAAEFFERLTNPDVTTTKTPTRHDHDQALAELEAAGI